MAASQRVLAPLALARPARVLILESSKMNAFSWPDGRIYVTRGLVERLTDDELAAALSHELGHLLQDHHVTVAALQGFAASGDCEAKADAWGCAILEARGIPRSAMTAMLTKVKTHLDDPARERAIAIRISILNGAAQ